MRIRQRIITVLAVGGLFAVPLATWADEDEHEEHERRGHGHRERREGRAPREALPPAPVPVGVEATYREECGSCHLAYPPGLLPRASWSTMLNGLADHFGQNAELDDSTRQELAVWLEANAAESNSHRKSAKVLRSLGGAAPLRLTEVPYLRNKHREVGPSTFSRKSIGSRANCPACHETADRWDFNEDWVSIPKS